MTATYKAMQAPAVPPSPESKKWVVRTFAAIAIALTILYLSLLVREGDQQTPVAKASHEQSEATLATASVTKSKLLTLTIPAGSKSKRLPLPFDMHNIVVSGIKYRLYTVYQDGHECSSFGKETCPDGSIEYYYIKNEMPREDSISYTFVPK